MNSQKPALKDIVLLGAGHAHAIVLRKFGLKPIPGVRLTLITRRALTPYSGMLPGLIARLYDFDDIHIDVGQLARFANARLYLTEAIGLDLENRRVLCSDRPPVPFDILSIDIGSTPSARDVPGVTEHAIPVKPIDAFLEHFEAARKRILAAKGHARVGVVGAGAGGVELILAIHSRLTRDVAAAGLDPAQLRFFLFSASDVLPDFPAATRKRFLAILAQRGIVVMTNGRVIAVEPGAVEVESHGRVAINEVFWTTEAEPARWLEETGLALDAKGFVRVAPTLQSVSHPDVFAAGDVASIEGYDLPRSGVYAVRAAPTLEENLRRLASGRRLTRYRPQRDALYLISTGERYAIGTRNGITFGGAWVWKLKDWIDRRYMAQFKALPEMPAELDHKGGNRA